jgi:hypothetical protein
LWPFYVTRRRVNGVLGSGCNMHQDCSHPLTSCVGFATTSNSRVGWLPGLVASVSLVGPTSAFVCHSVGGGFRKIINQPNGKPLISPAKPEL